MPTVKYPNNPNTDTAFVTDDNGKRTRTLKTVLVDGTVDYPSNANSSSCYVTIDGKKQRALMTADISSAGTVEFTNNSNSTKGYVTDNDGNKHRVILTAALAGGGSAPVIDELNVTPSTSAQTITAPSGTDGYSPVNVSAVDSSIDANIVAGNIKSGVSILGVNGSVVELNGTTTSVTPTTSAQTITPTAPNNGFTEVSVSAVTSAIDANIQAGNIKQGVTILGVAGNYSGITPTGTKSITANGVYDVTDFASADVQVPTTTPEIYRVFRVKFGKIENSISTPFIPLPSTATDISDYCFYSAYMNTPASVLSGAINLSSLTTISGTCGCYGMFQDCTGITSIDLSSLTTVNGSNPCRNMFQGCTGITSIDLSSLTTVSGSYACSNMFQGCTGITSINLSSLTTVSGSYGCQYMFYNCTGITSVDMSSLTTLSVGSGCYYMFAGCTGITSVDLSSLTTVSGGNACQYMFQDCTGITSVDMSSLTAVSGSYACTGMFKNCTGITSVDMSSLTTVSGHFACQNMVSGCTSLSTVYIGGTTAIDFGTRTNQFSGMFQNCTQNIDVYAPAANQSAIEAFPGYPNFGGTGNIVWHWRS